MLTRVSRKSTLTEQLHEKSEAASIHSVCKLACTAFKKIGMRPTCKTQGSRTMSGVSGIRPPLIGVVVLPVFEAKQAQGLRQHITTPPQKKYFNATLYFERPPDPNLNDRCLISGQDIC